MAKDDNGSRHTTDDERSVKALWTAMNSLETKLETKFNDLARDLHQALTPLAPWYPTARRFEAHTIYCTPSVRSKSPASYKRHHHSSSNDSLDSGSDVYARRRHCHSSPEFVPEYKDVTDVPHEPRNLRPPRHHRSRSDYRIKIDLPYFDGNMDIEDFLDWIQTVEKFFDYMRVPESKQVRLVAYKLKGGASAWWAQLE